MNSLRPSIVNFQNEIGYCSTCEHAVERHYDEHRKKKNNKYPYVCLLTGKCVTGRGLPISLYSERYPCTYISKADGYKERQHG